MINKKFLDPSQVIFRTGVGKGQTVVDLGVGSGYFAIASGKIVGDQGHVFVVDILEQALDHVMSEARVHKLTNIQTFRYDLESAGLSNIKSGCADLVVIANVLHQLKNQQAVFTESYRMLASGGKLLVVDWNSTPGHLGPTGVVRISEEKVKQLALASNLKFSGTVDTDNYHYGLIFTK